MVADDDHLLRVEAEAAAGVDLGEAGVVETVQLDGGHRVVAPGAVDEPGRQATVGPPFDDLVVQHAASQGREVLVGQVGRLDDPAGADGRGLDRESDLCGGADELGTFAVGHARSQTRLDDATRLDDVVVDGQPPVPDLVGFGGVREQGVAEHGQSGGVHVASHVGQPELVDRVDGDAEGSCGVDEARGGAVDMARAHDEGVVCGHVEGL